MHRRVDAGGVQHRLQCPGVELRTILLANHAVAAAPARQVWRDQAKTRIPEGRALQGKCAPPRRAGPRAMQQRNHRCMGRAVPRVRVVDAQQPASMVHDRFAGAFTFIGLRCHGGCFVDRCGGHLRMPHCVSRMLAALAISA